MAEHLTDQRAMHQIGEVAAQVGLSLRTIRYYEEVGLVTASGRSNGGFRLYTDDDIERLRLVTHMRPLDFSLAEMRDLLELRERLAGAAEDEARLPLLERLWSYVAAAEGRCQTLRLELAAAEAMASLLRREATKQRRPTRAR